MRKEEMQLLTSALKDEQGHRRRTQHILKVYAMAGLLGRARNIDEKGQYLLNRRAVVHDIAIKYCKESCEDASAENQKKYCGMLTEKFLLEAGYDSECLPPVKYMVYHHHDYHIEKDILLQMLVEADIIVNCLEEGCEGKDLDCISGIFVSQAGKELFDSIIKKEGR